MYNSDNNKGKRKRIGGGNYNNENGNYNNHSNKYSGRKPKRFNKKSETLDDVIKRRNQRLEEFFKLVNLPVRVIGNDNHPALVYEEKYILNAYVHNFELRFTDNPIQGNVIYTVRLTEKPLFDKNKIVSCIGEYDMRAVSKVYLTDVINCPKLYLSGYNFLDKKEKLGRYPVFSAYSPKVYFTPENAEIVKNELIADGYSVEIE